MIHITNTQKVSWLDYLYMVIMVIYLGQATVDTAAMVNTNILNHFIGFLIPFVFSIILAIKHNVQFKNFHLEHLLLLFAIWCFLIIIKYGFEIVTNYSVITAFYLFYGIIIAYIHVMVFRESLFPVYEHVIFLMSLISIALWCFAVFMPGLATPFFKSLPLADYSHYGNHFLYLFTWMNPSEGQVSNGVIRNAGCAWEPGRFAIMVCLAICLQFVRQGIKIKSNYRLLIMVIALALTQSTTGYSIFFLVIALFALRFTSIWSIIGFSVVAVVAFSFATSIDFLGEKLQDQTDFNNVFFELERRVSDVSNSYAEGEYAFSLDRFPAMYFEAINIINDPILGYTQMPEKSYFYNEISTNCSLTGGIFKVLGAFGILIGCYLYILLYRSSVFIYNTSSKSNSNKSKTALFFCILLSSISYNIWGCPIYMAIWLYGYFLHKKVNKK